MRIFLIRHGQSQGNLDGIIQGADDPLTALGRQQASAAGDWLAQRGDITHLYASPLARARETAGIIGAAIGQTPVLEPGLAEIDAGVAAGQLWEEWTLANPDAAERIRTRARTLDDGWEGGETGKQFRDRVRAAWHDVVQRHLGTDDVVAVVSHGGALMWISAMLHEDPDDAWPVERAIFQNCSVSELEIDADGVQTIGAWNVTDHLDSLEA